MLNTIIKFLQIDKVQHIMVCCTIASILRHLMIPVSIIAAIVTIIFMIKEVVDVTKRNNGKFVFKNLDWKDILANITGLLLGVF